jgi:hypothetical protein
MAKKVKTILDLDNNKITNLGNPTNQLDATNKDFIDELFIDLLNTGTWKYNNTLTTPPTINTFRMNNTVLASVTQIHINNTDLNSFVATDIFDKLNLNDIMLIQDTNDPSIWVKYRITGGGNIGSYFTFVVTYIFSIGTLTPNNSCKIKFIPIGSGINSVSAYSGNASINFGNDFISRTYTSVFVPNTNVISGTSIIILNIVASTDHPYPEESIMEGLIIKPDNIVDGVGFTIYATSINGSQGTYNIYYKIIN